MVADEEDPTIHEEPQHDHEDGSDRAVEKAEVIEVVEVDLHEPSKDEEERSGQQRARSKKAKGGFLV